MELTREQKRAVDTIDHNLQLIACAGSGKTEVITRRIANILTSRSNVLPEQIVAFTFTNKAADSMKERIRRALDGSGLEGTGERMYIGTIHAFCKQLLNRYSGTFQDYLVLDTVKTHLFAERYSRTCGLETLGLSRGPNDIKLFCTCIEKMVDDYNCRELWSQEQREVMEQYRSALYSRRFMDFSLLLLETMEQIKTNPQVGDYLKSIRYLIVDEYQDVNDLQEKLIAAIAAAGANICVVGDDDQTIYQFRGSNAGNMIGFAQRYPDVVQIRLEDNFRCAPDIVDIADTVIRNNGNRLEKKMHAQGDGTGGLAAARRYCNEEWQYRGIAEEIAACHENQIPYSEIAILVRKSKHIDAICQALGEKQIPYYTDSARQFFQGRYFSRFVQTLSMLADVDKAKLYECWQGILREDRLNAGFRSLRRAARSGGDGRSLPLGGVLRDFAELTGFLETGDKAAREDDLNGVTVILDDYDAIYGDCQLSARVSGVLRFLEERAEEEYKYHNFQGKNTAEDAVQIMTIHKSKGLEFHTVFLPNLQKGEFPASNRGGKQYWHVLDGRLAQNRERYKSDLEDERKLFYVAVTRAKKRLYLCWEDSKKLPSLFVAESAQSPALDRGGLSQEEIDIVLYKIDISRVRKLILEKVLAGAHSGLGGLYIEADEIRRASPVQVVRYAKEYNVPLV